MSRKVAIEVDGRTIEAEEGRVLLEVLLENGFEIPYYCYHEALGCDGNCRMCMVEIEGKKRPQISCDTYVSEGLVVRTDTDTIREVRRGVLELQLRHHPVDCPICDQAGECRLQDYYMHFGRYHGTVDKKEKRHFEKHRDLGKNVVLDQERCVLCRRCVRFVTQITGTGELAVVRRSDRSVIDTAPGDALHNDYAMNVVDLCPVGALTSGDFRFEKRVWFLRSTPSVCHGCARGCAITVDHAPDDAAAGEERIYRFRPRKEPRINGHFICDEGRMSYKELGRDRLTAPLWRGEAIDVSTALARWREMVTTHDGPIVVMADANLYTEALEAAKLFAERLGGAFCVPLEAYRDEAFGDDWLKHPMRAANAEGARALGVATTRPETDERTLLVNFGHPDAASLRVAKCVELTPHPPTRLVDLALPLAAWSETAGRLRNCDGIEQRCEPIVPPPGDARDVIAWVEWFDLAQRCAP